LRAWKPARLKRKAVAALTVAQQRLRGRPSGRSRRCQLPVSGLQRAAPLCLQPLCLQPSRRVRGGGADLADRAAGKRERRVRDGGPGERRGGRGRRARSRNLGRAAVLARRGHGNDRGGERAGVPDSGEGEGEQGEGGRAWAMMADGKDIR
jgi:hypothetical protein